MPKLTVLNSNPPKKYITCGPKKIDAWNTKDRTKSMVCEASSIPSVLSHLRSQPINDIDGMLLSKVGACVEKCDRQGLDRG